MEGFNKDEMIDKGKELRYRLRNVEKIVAIVQAGSSPEKRFNREHINIITNHVRKLMPDSSVLLVSDDFGDPITETAAKLYAADTTITTDTFLGHLAAGCRVMRDDRDGRLQPGDWLGLYTLGWPDVWAIPGGHVSASPAVLKYQADKDLSSRMWSIIDQGMYYDVVGKSPTTGIVRNDMNLLLNDIDQLLRS